MRTVALLAAMVLATLAVVGTVVAQKRQGPAEGPPPPPAAGRPVPPSDRGKSPMDPQEEQDLRKLVETVKMVRLSQELGLSDEETVLLVRQYDEARARIGAMVRERQQILRHLRDSVRDGKPEAEIQEALDRLIAQDRRVADAKMQVYEKVGQNLTATQRAKLYVFINDFEADMRRMIQRAREIGRAGALRGREGLRGRPGELGDEVGGPPRPPLGPRGRGAMGPGPAMGPQPGPPPPPEGGLDMPPPPAGPPPAQ